MKWFVLVILIIAVAILLWNFFCRKNSKRKIEGAYGQALKIDGYKIVVDIKGAGNGPTIVLLPGWGCASPVLEFLPLAKALSQDFRVITIELFIV